MHGDAKSARRWAVLCLMIAQVLAPAAAQGASDEERVGEAAAARILGAAPLLDAPVAQRYLNRVGATIAQHTQTAYRWRFGILRTDSVNAFATPGGFVLVTAGLLKQLQSEEELALVVAHEIAHVVRRDHYRVVLRQRLAEAAAKSLQEASGVAMDATLSQASAQLYARGLDRSAEIEADRLGVELTTRAGYDPAAALAVLEKLRRLRGDDPRAALLFSTHPSPGARLEMLLESGLDALPRPAPSAMAQRGARFRQFLASF